MSAYAVPIPTASAQSSKFCGTLSCTQRPSQFLPSRQEIARSRRLRISEHIQPLRELPKCVAQIAKSALEATEPADNEVNLVDWKHTVQPEAVIEVFLGGELRFAFVTDLYENGAVAKLIEIGSGSTRVGSEAKVSFGEIISVWDPSIAPIGPDIAQQLADDVSRGLRFLKNAPPRSLDLADGYDELRKFSKNDERGMRSSTQIADIVFPMSTEGSRERNAARTVAAAIAVAADNVRFKRAAPGKGWRALPPSVAVAKGRCSFVDMCKSIIANRSSSSLNRTGHWSREHLEILRDLEVVAASGTAAKGTSAIALEALGYEPTDVGAAQLLMDIEYWASSDFDKLDPSVVPATKRNGDSENLADADRKLQESESIKSAKVVDKAVEWYKNQYVRDWTFTPQILAEAKDLRLLARSRRWKYLSASNPTTRRRNLMNTNTMDGKHLRLYCIDERSTRFLDDAFSIERLDNSSTVRVAAHITDVDQVVKYGSAIDDLARERGQSLYLPLKPLHMLPASIMDAASFSTSLPGEAITVMVDFDVKRKIVRKWEVFASIVPPVTRISYDQFDLALQQGAEAAEIEKENLEDLSLLAQVAPLLANILDQRSSRRRQKVQTEARQGGTESRGVASVRLVKKPNGSTSNGVTKVAKVVDFRSTGAHAVVGDLLTSVGALIRQFAKENRAHLPEDKGASAHAARCGTAPLRRYADLAVQRQVKCVLFGRQPAGRRRMDELRVWLARRHSAGERTVAERRRSVLFDSLSDHCAQQCATSGSKHAVLRGQVRNLAVTKRGALKVDVVLDGTGLSAIAAVSDDLLEEIQNAGNNIGFEDKDKEDSGSAKEFSQSELMLIGARSIFKPQTKVQVRILDISTASQSISATIIGMAET